MAAMKPVILKLNSEYVDIPNPNITGMSAKFTYTPEYSPVETQNRMNE